MVSSIFCIVLGCVVGPSVADTDPAKVPAEKVPLAKIKFIDVHVHAMSIKEGGLEAVAKWMDEEVRLASSGPVEAHRQIGVVFPQPDVEFRVVVGMILDPVEEGLPPIKIESLVGAVAVHEHEWHAGAFGVLEEEYAEVAFMRNDCHIAGGIEQAGNVITVLHAEEIFGITADAEGQVLCAIGEAPKDKIRCGDRK